MVLPSAADRSGVITSLPRLPLTANFWLKSHSITASTVNGGDEKVTPQGQVGSVS